MKTPEQWAQEIELRCVADNRRPRIAVEADVILEAVNEAIEDAAWAAETLVPGGNRNTIALAIRAFKLPDAQ